jgi:Ca-activated chloride channel family protein
MEAEDFKPNRLEAAKSTAKEFIDYRLNDRIGLALFAGESFTQCPITSDHSILKSFFKDIKTKMLEDGTAIGMGLSTAVNRLKTSSAKSKVIILLTDGVNNTGKISPMSAADLAKSFNIRVYTIGVGAKGKAPYLVDTPFGKQYVYMDVEIDEDLLKQIASYTGGAYFRATNNKALENIYASIDKMEKTKINEKTYNQVEDKFSVFLLLGLFVALVEETLRLLIFRTLP